MTHVYVWSPGSPEAPSSELLFTSVIHDECTFLGSCLAVPVTSTIRSINGVFTAQIAVGAVHPRCELWDEGGGFGVAWSGVCENAPRTEGDASRLSAFGKVVRDPGAFMNLDGRFVVCVWDSHRNEVVCAASMTATLPWWMLEGPQGLALGNRLSVLHRLADRQAILDSDAAKTFLALEYHALHGCFHAGSRSVEAGTILEIGRGARIVKSQRCSLVDFIGHGTTPGLGKGLVRRCADRLVDRIGVQMRVSNNPAVLLTGGVDSRCIAAAAVAAGFRGSAITSGPPGNPNVGIAREVARRLKLPFSHMNPVGRHSGISLLRRNPGRVRMWIRFTEGIDTLRHAIPHQSFFSSRPVLTQPATELFHGIEGLTSLVAPQRVAQTESGANMNASALLGLLLRHDLPLRHDLAPLAEDLFGDFFREIGGGGFDVWQILQLAYWRKRTQHFIGNSISVADHFHWHWAPLLDGTLIGANLQASLEQRAQKTLLREITEYLAPRLRGLHYRSSAVQRPAGWRGALLHLGDIALGYHPRLPYLGRTRIEAVPCDDELRRFWRWALLTSGRSTWKEYLREDAIRQDIANGTGADMLWRATTLQLFADALAGVAE